MKNIVFVGNSVANAKAIEEIRKNYKESAITFVSSDAFYPYAFDRLCAFLRREIKEKQSLYHPESFYKQNKVRVINGRDATAAKVRVLLQSTDGDAVWTTVGVSTDIIEASWIALVDSIEYKLLVLEEAKCPM